MTVAATSLKIPATLKERIEALAEDAGQSPHALMIAALQSYVEDAELHSQFVRDAQAADAAMQKSGVGYGFDEVRRYLEARIAGKAGKKSVARPKPRKWRR